MEKADLTMAEQIALAASRFEQQRTGHRHRWVAVFLNADTMLITLHAALTTAEKAFAACPAGAAQVQEFHRRLFTTASTSLWGRIRRITGMQVREATAEVETTTGTVVQVFTTHTVIQEFLTFLSVLTGHAQSTGQISQAREPVKKNKNTAASTVALDQKSAQRL
jgi:uncharacterized protein YbcI